MSLIQHISEGQWIPEIIAQAIYEASPEVSSSTGVFIEWIDLLPAEHVRWLGWADQLRADLVADKITSPFRELIRPDLLTPAILAKHWLHLTGMENNPSLTTACVDLMTAALDRLVSKRVLT